MNTMALLAPAASMPDVNIGGEMLRVVLSLGAIVVLIFAAGWLTRRLQGRPLGGHGRRLRAIETLQVGARERVVLVEADGKRLLLGVGAGGVRSLHVYEGEVPIDSTPPPPATPPFAELLGRLGRKS